MTITFVCVALKSLGNLYYKIMKKQSAKTSNRLRKNKNKPKAKEIIRTRTSWQGSTIPHRPSLPHPPSKPSLISTHKDPSLFNLLSRWCMLGYGGLVARYDVRVFPCFIGLLKPVFQSRFDPFQMEFSGTIFQPRPSGAGTAALFHKIRINFFVVMRQ